MGDDRQQVQWGRIQALPQLGVLVARPESRLVSLKADAPDEPIRGYIVACSRNLLNPLGVPQPTYHIQAGVGAVVFDWRGLAPGTYILYAQSLDVYASNFAAGAVEAQAWAGLTQAAPTLVLP